MLNLELYLLLVLGIFLILVGFWSLIFFRKNIILILVAIELLILSINIHFIVFSLILDDIIGQLFTIFTLTVAAGETSIGLALLINFYKIKGDIRTDALSNIKS